MSPDDESHFWHGALIPADTTPFLRAGFACTTASLIFFFLIFLIFL